VTSFFYLGCLLIGIAGLLTIDYRLHLAFWNDPKRTASTLLAAVGVFIVWDLAGIALGIFAHGHSRFSLPLTIVPQFPLEELGFLFLLCYITLLLYLGAQRRWPRT
jgi:lycopene cyclase domain-containing protein